MAAKRGRGLLSFGNQGFDGSGAPPASSPDAIRLTQFVWEVAVRNLEAPPVAAACTGGGTVASAADPTQGASLTTATEPVAWVTLHLDSGDRTYSYGPLPDPLTYHGGFKEARVLAIDAISRGISDNLGGFQSARVRVRLIDTDYVLRTRMAAETLFKRLVTIYVADDTTRRAQGTARRVGKFIIDNVVPVSDLSFDLELTDYISSRVGPFLRYEEFLRVTLTKTLFSTLPDQYDGMPAPIIYGSLSDEQNDTSPSDDTLDPPTITVTRYGSAGGTTVSYQVTACNAQGETTASNTATLTDSLPLASLNTVNFNHVHWDPVPGATHYRVFRNSGAGMKFVDQDSLDEGGQIPHQEHIGKVHYNDGEIHGREEHDIEKDPGPPSSNTAYKVPQIPGATLSQGTVPTYYSGEQTLGDGSVWMRFIVCRHAIAAVQSWYASDLSEPTPARIKMPAGTEGSEFLIPGKSGWTALVGANKYVDIGGYRWTVIYARGTRAEHARDGKVPISLNICGLEQTGDGTGAILDNLPRQVLHFLNNFVVQDATGNWLAIAAEQGVPLFKTTDFETLKTKWDTLVGGSGLTGGWIAGGEHGLTTLDAFLQAAARCMNAHFGINEHGQLTVGTLDTTDPSVATFTDLADVIDRDFTVAAQPEDLVNEIRYRYERRYVKPVTKQTPADGELLPPTLAEDKGEWVSGQVSLSDTTSITDNKIRKRVDIDLPMLRTKALADFVVTRMLTQLKVVRVHYRWRTDLRGLVVDLLKLVRLTHFAGAGASGAANRLVRVRRVGLDLDEATVLIEGDDVTGL